MLFLATRTVCGYFTGRRRLPPAGGFCACTPSATTTARSGCPILVCLFLAPVGSVRQQERQRWRRQKGGRCWILSLHVLMFDLICTQHKWVGSEEGGLCAAAVCACAHACVRVCVRFIILQLWSVCRGWHSCAAMALLFILLWGLVCAV